MCNRQSARLLPRQTGFNQQRRLRALVACECQGWICLYGRLGTVGAHQLVVQDGLVHHLDLRQLRGGLRLDGECIQRHNHCNLHICKIRQGGGDGAATLWDQEPPESRDGQGSYFAVLTCCCRLDTVPTVNASSGWLSGNFWLKCTSLQLAAAAWCITKCALETALEAAAAPLRPWPSIRANAQRRPH